MTVYSKALQKDDVMYWKKVRVPYLQPILRSNGSFWGNDFAVDRWAEYGGLQNYDAWGAFSGDINTWTGEYRDQRWSAFNLRMYYPLPVIVTGCQFFQHGGWGSEEGAVNSSEVYGSNDGNNWAWIASHGGPGNGWSTYTFSNSTPYRFLRLRIIAWGSGKHDYIKTASVKMTTHYETVVPAKSTDAGAFTVPCKNNSMIKVGNEYYRLGEIRD